MNITVEGGKSKKLLTGGKYCPEDITVTAEAPAAVEEKDVNFYDYDGTCLYAYTIAEAQALTELPPLPSHEGLICQGWNWTIEQVTALQFPMDIGALYTTDDGWSRFYLDVPVETTIELCCRTSNRPDLVTYDWGDGSAQETPVAVDTTICSGSHTYAPGKYILRIFSTAPGFTIGRNSYVNLFNVTGSPASNMLYKAEIADGTYLFATFYGCARLETVSLPNGIRLNNSEFRNCPNLKAVIFPQSVTSLSNSCCQSSNIGVISLSPTIQRFSGGAFRYSSNRRKIGLPEGMHTFGERDFEEGYAYEIITIPSTITNIGANAFLSCRGLRILRFLPTTPPTVANANAFQGIPTTCIVEVPAESLEAYQNATNYSGIAAQMVGV